MALIVGTNTYSTLADSNDYFLTRYNSSAWNNLDDSIKESLKISATRALDLYCDWLGNKTDSDQNLEFPRDSNPVPGNVIIAENEIAFSILESGSISETKTSAVKKSKLDVLEEEYFNNTTKESSIYNDFTDRLLSGLCYHSGISGGKSLIRV